MRRPIAELANRLPDSAIMIPRPVFQKHENPWHNKLKCKVYTYPSIQIPFIQFDWSIPVGFEFFRLMHMFFREYDVVHIWTFFYISSFYAMLVRRYSKGTKLIMSLDTLPAISFKSGFVDMLFKIYYRFFWRTFFIPDKVHFYTVNMAREFSKIGKILKKRKLFIPKTFSIAPTGIDIKKFDKEVRDRDDKNIVVIYAGLISKRKGVDRMIKAAKNFDWPYSFYLIGDGPDYKKYTGYIKSNVFTEKWAENIIYKLKNSDICMLLSRGEGLPGLVMEAMACKLPIIATNILGNQELVEHTVNGFLVNTDDEIKNALELLGHPTMRQVMGNVSYKKIQKYDWKKILPLYKTMYKEVQNA